MARTFTRCTEGCSYNNQEVQGTGWEFHRCPDCGQYAAVVYFVDSFNEIQAGLQFADITLTGVVGCWYEGGNQGFISSNIQGRCVAIHYLDGEDEYGETTEGYCFAEVVDSAS